MPKKKVKITYSAKRVADKPNMFGKAASESETRRGKAEAAQRDYAKKHQKKSKKAKAIENWANQKTLKRAAKAAAKRRK